MLILLAGYDRCGKDSAYEAIKSIESELPFNMIERIALADHLKEVAYKLFGVTESMKGTGAEEYYRMVLTKLSEAMKIASGNDCYFADYLINKISKDVLNDKDSLYVCTDGRYDYEIARFGNVLLKGSFCPIRIRRSDFPPTKYALENHNFSNYSSFRGHIENDGSLDLYKDRIRNFVKNIASKINEE